MGGGGGDYQVIDCIVRHGQERLELPRFTEWLWKRNNSLLNIISDDFNSVRDMLLILY